MSGLAIAIVLIIGILAFVFCWSLAKAAARGDARVEQMNETRRLALLSPEERLEDLKRRAYEQRDV